MYGKCIINGVGTSFRPETALGSNMKENWNKNNTLKFEADYLYLYIKFFPLSSENIYFISIYLSFELKV
jgi:hypothetical protein